MDSPFLQKVSRDFWFIKMIIPDLSQTVTAQFMSSAQLKFISILSSFVLTHVCKDKIFCLLLHRKKKNSDEKTIDFMYGYI